VRLLSLTGASGGLVLKCVKGENLYWNVKVAHCLELLTGGKPTGDKQGMTIQVVEYHQGEDETKPDCVAPDCCWFGA
jgi:hypothetical protein